MTSSGTSGGNIHRYAGPYIVLRTGIAIQPYLTAAALLLFALGSYLAFFASPPDYQQGETVRIMYIHVPAAIMSMAIYSTMAVCSFLFLVYKHPVNDLIARASCPIGAGFALITLITGAAWGKPMWGAWWVWDARLTSMLILFFLYIGYGMVARQASHDINIQKICAMIALIGAINIPIVKFSVDWWATLHQPASLLRMGGPAIHHSMMPPLITMGLACCCFYLSLVIAGMRSLTMQARLHRLRMQIMA